MQTDTEKKWASYQESFAPRNENERDIIREHASTTCDICAMRKRLRRATHAAYDEFDRSVLSVCDEHAEDDDTPLATL